MNTLFGVGNGDQAARNRQSRENLYNQTQEDTRNYYMQDLDKQSKAALKTNRFSLARRGLSGGSRDLDMRQKHQEEYDRGVLDIAGRADDSANQFRMTDEDKRLNLLSRIQQGMDAVTAQDSAISGMKLNLQNAKAASTAQNLGNVFSVGQEGMAAYAPDSKWGKVFGQAGTAMNNIRKNYQGQIGGGG